jgi:hypothetical protein
MHCIFSFSGTKMPYFFQREKNASLGLSSPVRIGLADAIFGSVQSLVKVKRISLWLPLFPQQRLRAPYYSFHENLTGLFTTNLAPSHRVPFRKASSWDKRPVDVPIPTCSLSFLNCYQFVLHHRKN